MNNINFLMFVVLFVPATYIITKVVEVGYLMFVNCVEDIFDAFR